MLFDEQFNYVTGGFSRVNGTAASLKDHHADLTDLTMTKNGYLYIYASNESPVAVFFDNLQVVYKPGPILEETHYYPFGLTMAGISSKSAGSLENKRKFNDGTELNTSFDINLYETSYRLHDPQIGRFHQIDPLAGIADDYSPYSYVLNNPLLFNDPYGLDTTRGNTPKPEPLDGDVWIPDEGGTQIYNNERNGWSPLFFAVTSSHTSQQLSPNELRA